MFSEDMKFEEAISIDEAWVILDLPEIIDDEFSSLKSIQIDSLTFGSIMSSNETIDFKLESDQFISYSFYEN